MSSVLHPVGPEAPQTYWVRRIVVIAAAVLVLAVVIAVIVNGSASGSAAQTTPPPPTPTSVAATSATPTASGDPTDTFSPAPTGTSASTPSGTGPVSPNASGTASKSPSTKATPSAKATTKATTKAKAKAKPAVPTACAASDLRVTLTGKQRLKTKQKTTLALSVINGSARTCVVQVTPNNFTLTIYSGRDRIWTSNDCSTAVKPVNKKLASQQDVGWSMVWNGRRSRSDCKNRPEIPRAGTYIATAKLDGAKAVRMRMILRKA